MSRPTEYAVFVPFGDERLACVLTVPETAPRGLWVMMTGQGAPRGTQYHYPLWTDVARRLAAEGVASVRMDHLGVGDSTDPREVLAPAPGREQEPIAVARWGMAATGATAVGFAGHCYGGRLAVEAGIAMHECVGVVAAHYAPPVDMKTVSTLRRMRYRLRMWGPVSRLSMTPFGRRVLEPVVTRVFGRRRTIDGVNARHEEGLRSLLGRARITFVNGDDEARYHLRLRPFLDRFVPTLPTDHVDRIESVLTPAQDVGGYMAYEAQLSEVQVVVPRMVAFVGARGSSVGATSDRAAG